MKDKDVSRGAAVPPAVPSRLYRSDSMFETSKSPPPNLSRNGNRKKPPITSSEEILDHIYEDPDILLASIREGGQSEDKPKPTPLPRIRYKPKPRLCHTTSTTNTTYTDPANTTCNGNKTENPSHTNTTDMISINTTSSTYTTNKPHYTNTSNSTNNIRRTRTMYSTYTSNSTRMTKTNEPSDKPGNIITATSNRSEGKSDVYMRPRPAHPPPLPPLGSRDGNSTAAISGQNYYSRTTADPTDKPPALSIKKRPLLPPPPPPPPPRPEPTSSLYANIPNPAESQTSRDPDSPSKPAVPPRLYRSTSMVVVPNLRSTPSTPSVNQQDPPYSRTHYNHRRLSRYIDVLPEEEHDMGRRRSRLCPEQDCQSEYGSIYQLSTDDMTELLQWLKRVSAEPDALAPAQYVVCIDEEIRSFTRRAMHVRKAGRLYNLLMMKRKDNLQNGIKELRSVCDRLDKVQKTNKAMGIAGGTTGALGGVAAVVGIALAPVTMGTSLIATAVGAGIAASAGGFGAHAAKVNKKAVNRQTMERLVNDYRSDVVDLERCLHFILCVMNELRRHNVDRLQRAGAHPGALRIADLLQVVFRNNVDGNRGMSLTHAGGVTSGGLLKAFANEFDQYFTEKGGQKLKKSNKSRFSGRVATLIRSLQEELDYLIQMWEILG